MNSRGRKPPECNYYKERGYCRKGSACKYSHVIDKPIVLQQRLTNYQELMEAVRVELATSDRDELQKLLKAIGSSGEGVAAQEGDSLEEALSCEEAVGPEVEEKEHERHLGEKYKHIPDGIFKRNFVSHLMGNFRAGREITKSVSCSLERDPAFDYTCKKELVEKMGNSREYNTIFQYRSQLPVYDSKATILSMINNNQVIVISGETGCGKTTQVAQFILDDYILKNQGSLCHIVCTQPRRISAVSVAERVAEERVEPIGESVGYQIRLDKRLPRQQGSILFCTTGILLKNLNSNIGLSQVSHVMIDEIHERNMETDFVLTIVREIMRQRKDLKVILMSATVNAQQFADYFHSCPIITVPGKLFPVTEYYLEDVLKFTSYIKLDLTNRRKFFKDSMYSSMLSTFADSLRGKFGDVIIQQLLDPFSERVNLELIQSLIEYICSKKPSGAILVFLPGWDTISDLCGNLVSSSFFNQRTEFRQEEPEDEDYDEDEDYNDDMPKRTQILRGLLGREFLILPLHSNVPSEKQKLVFKQPPPGVRKIIVSTNIAETSITINDVVYIIDSGKMKVKSYEPERNVPTLLEEWVSKANAKQRKGRAGRVQEGECYFMYTSLRAKLLEPYAKPEILRSRLEDLIVKIKLLELGKVAPILKRVMDSPEHKIVNSSIKSLITLRALDHDENLTPLGYHLAKLALDANIAKMIIFATIFSCVDPILSLAACLNFKQPFYNKVGQGDKAKNNKIQLSSGNKSDHLVLIEAFKMWENCQSRKEEKRLCRKNFLSVVTLRELKMLKMEFAENLHEMGFLDSTNAKEESVNINSSNVSVLKAVIFAGLYPNIAIVEKVQKLSVSGTIVATLRTPEDGEVKLHRSSINEGQLSFESPYLVYDTKIKSSHVFLHHTTMISSLPCILFSHKVNYSNVYQNIEVNGEITFHCDRNLANLYLELRQELQKVIDAFIMEPATVKWYEDNQRADVLRAVTALITNEDQHLRGKSP